MPQDIISSPVDRYTSILVSPKAGEQSSAYMGAEKIIKRFEGLSLKAYKCSAGVWTIGWGNTSYLKDFKNPVKIQITQIKAQELLKQDMLNFYNCVLKQLSSICNDNQIASLTSFCFNVGQKAFLQSTLLKVIKEKNHIQSIRIILENAFKTRLTKGKYSIDVYNIKMDLLYHKWSYMDCIQNEFLEWTYANNKQILGLVNRRNEEFKLYCL